MPEPRGRAGANQSSLREKGFCWQDIFIQISIFKKKSLIFGQTFRRDGTGKSLLWGFFTLSVLRTLILSYLEKSILSHIDIKSFKEIHIVRIHKCTICKMKCGWTKDLMRDQVNDLDGTPWYMWHMWLYPVVGPFDAERGRKVRGPRGGGSNLKGCQDHNYSWNSRVQ